MIYREPRFLAVVWFGCTPTSFPLLPSGSCLSFSVFLSVAFAGRAYWREKGGKVGLEPNHRKKAWPSINRLILCACHPSPLVAPRNRKEHTLTTSRLTFSPMSMFWQLPHPLNQEEDILVNYSSVHYGDWICSDLDPWHWLGMYIVCGFSLQR